MLESSVRAWAIWCHLAGFGGIVPLLICGNVLGPLIVWLIGREKSEEIDAHGKEAVNFQITMWAAAFIAYAASFIASLFIALLLPKQAEPVLIGIDIIEITFYITMIGLWLYAVIAGAVAAANGRRYRYPLSIRLIR